jgi:flagellar hook assembly protein FlgD
MVSNALGQRVRLLFQGYLPPGHYSIEWDGTADDGIIMPGGSYYAVLKAGYMTRTVRMVYLK